MLNVLSKHCHEAVRSLEKQCSCGVAAFCGLFPLDGGWGLGGDVVDDAVDAVDLAGDAAGHGLEQLPREVDELCGDGVNGVDGADGDGVVVAAAAVLDAGGLDGDEDGEGLPGLVVPAGLGQLLGDDGVGLAQHGQRRAGDGADVADAQRRAGEGMAVEHLGGHAQQAANRSDLVLEQAVHRLDQLELQILGQAAHVVVRLDDALRVAVQRNGLQDVRIDGPLAQEGGVDLAGRLGEDVDELLADNLPLRLRVADARQLVEEAVRGVDVLEVHVVVLLEDLLDLLGLVLAQQPVVDEDAGEAVADGLVDEHGDHGGVDAAGESEDDGAVADLLADVRDGLVDELLEIPGAGAAAGALAEFDERRDVGGAAADRGGGDAELGEGGHVGARRAVVADDDADGLLRQDAVCGCGVGHDHGVDALVTDAAGDALDVLAACIDEDDGLWRGLHGLGCWMWSWLMKPLAGCCPARGTGKALG